MNSRACLNVPHLQWSQDQHPGQRSAGQSCKQIVKKYPLFELKLSLKNILILMNSLLWTSRIFKKRTK